MAQSGGLESGNQEDGLSGAASGIEIEDDGEEEKKVEESKSS